MEWKISAGITPYQQAMADMEARQHAVQQGTADELIWLLEHPPLYTAGRSAKAQDLLSSQGFEVHEVGRGGQYTYHGPGQRVVYLVLDLNNRGKDVRAYVKQLENWIIDALAEFGVQGFIRKGRVGVWVAFDNAGEMLSPEPPLPLRGSPQAATHGTSTAEQPNTNANQQGSPLVREALRPTAQPAGGAGVKTKQPAEAKIAALGVRLQKWVTTHGIAINLNPDLSHYAGIVPCGIAEFGVTSLHDMGHPLDMAQLDEALRTTCPFTR